MSKDCEWISLNLSTNSIALTVDDWLSIFLSLEELSIPLSKSPSDRKLEGYAPKFVSIFGRLSGEKSFSSLIAFCKVIGISDSIFHS
jgi:hypothetical protein